MRLAGQWVGWGLADNNPRVSEIRRFMTTKFRWARDWQPPIGDSPLFDKNLTAATIEMQRRYGIPQTGTWNYQTQVKSGFHQVKPVDTRPVLFTVCGTGVPWWVGPDADTARAVEDRYKWAPVGYGARPFPMEPSVAEGLAELVRLIELWRPEIEKTRKAAALIGFSQGAIIVAECWEDLIKPPGARLSWFKPYVKKMIFFGNPMREAGNAHYCPNGTLPDPRSHGIADRLMVQTPDFVRNFAHKGDLYTDCSGQSGENKTAIYKIIMGARMFDGPDSLLAQFMELGTSPMVEGIAMMQAVLDAGMFFAAGTGPHVNYSPQPAIDYLRAA